MKKHGNLFEKIFTFENLLTAAKKASSGKRGKKTVASFQFNLEHEIITLINEIESGTYQPRDFNQFEISEPKLRKISSSAFRDRVVHHAICNVIEPLLENKAIFDSYACRNNKGAHAAVARCQFYVRKFKFFLKCDIRKFFDNVHHDILKSMLHRIIKDKKLLSLLDVIIEHTVSDGQSGRGLPIGNLTSQHFANYYLGALDHYLKDRLRVKGYVRYMDDFLLFSDSKEELNLLLLQIEQFLESELRLELKEKVTTLAPVTEGISFLGFRVYPSIIRIKRENLVRMRRKIRKKEKLFTNGKIFERELAQSVNSIVAHVSHVNSLAQRRDIFNSSLILA